MTHIEEKGLGRLPKVDLNDFKYMLRHRAPRQAVQRKTKRWAMFERVLDQGKTGTCVGHAWKHFLMTAPVIQSSSKKAPSAIDIYVKATDLDEWRGNEGDLQFGSSIRAGAKAVRFFEFITEFNWEFTASGMVDWLAGVDDTGKWIGGPMVIGINYYSSMYNTDDQGFLHITPNARLDGGHALCVDLYNEEQGAFGGPNSWGVFDFGQRIKGTNRRNGRWKMAGELMERLIERENGEACTARELRIPA